MFEYLIFNEHYSFSHNREVRIESDGDKLRYLMDGFAYDMQETAKQSGVYKGDADSFIRRLEAFDVPSWKEEYYRPVLDGYGWNLRYKEVGKRCRKISGSNDGPDCYDEFADLLFSIMKEGFVSKREGARDEIIGKTAVDVASDIMKLEIGSKTSLERLVDFILSNRGYSFEYLGPDDGYAWTKDNGRTYFIADFDLFDVLDIVEESLKGKRLLDFSEHDGKCEGYPYNLDFIIRSV